MQNKHLIVGLAVVLIAGGVIAIAMASNNKTQVASEATEADAMMQKKEDATMMEKNKLSDDKMQKADGEAMQNGDAMMKESQSTYVDYSPEVLVQAQTAQKSGRKVVLFFHAKWCPLCIAADKDFRANIGTDAFPKNVTLIKTDYDTQTELKKKYGITTQHTFVQIDSNGNQITKWISGETSDLNKNLK